MGSAKVEKWKVEKWKVEVEKWKLEKWKSRKGKDQIQMSYRCSAEMCAYECINLYATPLPLVFRGK